MASKDLEEIKDIKTIKDIKNVFYINLKHRTDRKKTCGRTTNKYWTNKF